MPLYAPAGAGGGTPDDGSVTNAKVAADAAIVQSKLALDADLTTISGLTATTDNFVQSKASAWASRTLAQVKTDLALDLKSNLGLSGTTAAMTNALAIANPGVYYRNTDEGRLYQSNGATWDPVPPYELASASKTANQTGIPNALTTITGLSITQTMLAKPYMFELVIPGVQSDTVGSYASFYLVEDATGIRNSGVYFPLANTDQPLVTRKRYTPTAGSHTYIVQCYYYTGTGKISADATGNEAQLRIEAI